MSPEELRSRLRTGEDGRTEFKSVGGEGPEKDALAKELVAFANAGGGHVFLGVEDDGVVTGVGNAKGAETWQRFVAQTAKDSVRPALRVSLQTVEVDGRLVVVVDVPGYQQGRPFQGRSKYFLRDGRISREASTEELKRLLVSGASTFFDEYPVPDASEEDLDRRAVDALLEKLGRGAARNSPERTLRALKLVGADGTPTVAGILLCGKDPQSFFVDARVSAVRYSGAAPSKSILDREEIGGTVPDQLVRAADFIARHVPSPERVEGLERRMTGVPAEVWREAIMNALCHRDYNAASQTRIFVFDDRVEIANPGGLMNAQTIEGIRLVGSSLRRNPYLAAVMMRLGYAESLGIGIPEMIRQLVELGLPDPELRAEHGEFRLVIRTVSGSASEA